MSVLQRQRTEALITLNAARALLDAGYFLAVNDGEDDTVTRTRDLHEVARALMKTDDDIITASDAEERVIGRVQFVYGNDGYDVIHDYSTTLHEVLRPVFALAETFAPGERRSDVEDVVEQVYRHMVALTPANIAEQLNEVVGELNTYRMSVRTQPIGNLIGMAENKLRKLVERIRSDQSGA